MGRPTLSTHRKFARLARLLGSEAAARGHLEFVWEGAYAAGDDLLGDAGDVEHAARWTGKPGRLAAALVEAGFLDLRRRRYYVHDLYDHAPEYVRKRMDREEARRVAGRTLSEVRAEAARKRWKRDASAEQKAANVETVAAASNASGTPPAPPPAPAPSPAHQPPDPPAGGLVGEDAVEWLREKLAEALDLETLGVGKDVEGVLRFFREEIATEGKATVLADCLEAIRRKENNNELPKTLAWFVAWLRPQRRRRRQREETAPPPPPLEGDPFANLDPLKEAAP